MSQSICYAVRRRDRRRVGQRCYVHFLRNALDYLPRKADDDCLQELRWLYDPRNLEESRCGLVAWLQKWQQKYPKLCNWVEESIEETLSFCRLPLQLSCCSATPVCPSPPGRFVTDLSHRIE